MNISDLKTKVFEEIQQIPDNKLIELFSLIHTFRLRLKPAPSQAQLIMQFAGCWKDLPNETYTALPDALEQDTAVSAVRRYIWGRVSSCRSHTRRDIWLNPPLQDMYFIIAEPAVSFAIDPLTFNAN
jgi:hypothetical protein